MNKCSVNILKKKKHTLLILRQHWVRCFRTTGSKVEKKKKQKAFLYISSVAGQWARSVIEDHKKKKMKICHSPKARSLTHDSKGSCFTVFLLPSHCVLQLLIETKSKMWLFISTVETFFLFKTSQSEACLVSFNTEKSTGTHVHAARWQKNPLQKTKQRIQAATELNRIPVSRIVWNKKRIMCGSCLKS